MFKAMKKKSTVVKRGTVDHTKIGLVTEGLFPLYNEEYVVNAIKFFNLCPLNKRLELAANINEQARNLNLTIEISEKDPFYKYVNKNIVSTLMTEAFDGSAPTDTIEVCCKSDPFIREVIRKIQDWKLTDLTSLRDLETYIITNATTLRNKNTALIVSGINKLNVFWIINSIMIERYKDFYNKLKYVDNDPISEDRIRFNNLIIKILDDIFFLIHNRILDGKPDPLFIKEKLDIVMDMYNTLRFNGFVINRYLYQAMMDVVTLVEPDDTIEEANERNYDIVMMFEKYMLTKIDNDINKLFISDKFIIDTFNLVDSSFIEATKYLETMKGLISSEVKTILMNDNPMSQAPNDDLFFILKDVVCRHCYGILDILTALEGQMRSRNIKFYDKDYCLHLNSIDVLYITEKLRGSYFDKIYTNHCRGGHVIYFGIKKYELYLFGKSSDGYIAIKLYGADAPQSLNNSYMNFLADKPNSPLKIFVISPTPRSIDMNVLTEGINVSKTGDVKFTFNKNMSYMDAYDKAHKQLDANWKAKNYEGMKTNIAYLFTMVLNIEREYIHNPGKVNEAKKADAVKARMFAINDFKSYLIKLKTAEPSFDFTKYYEENGYDKISFTVGTDTMLGIKKIFQMIMMG